jgi:hypothetical protein
MKFNQASTKLISAYIRNHKNYFFKRFKTMKEEVNTEITLKKTKSIESFVKIIIKIN